MNVLQFKEMKSLHRKISMITCYDYTSARIVANTPIDAVLVGDSAAMTMHGFQNTISADLNMMCAHIAAVVRGAPEKFVIGDMPFLSFRKSLSENMAAVEALMRAGAHAVKVEGVLGNETLIQHLVQSGVPVMGHLGLTPQFVHTFGGFKVQGRDDQSAKLIELQAQALQDLGAFSLVLECVPSTLAKKITDALSIPTIGIGAGPFTDGQVLVFQDALGLNSDFKPKFVRRFLDGAELFKMALTNFHESVVARTFPNTDESFDYSQNKSQKISPSKGEAHENP